MKVSHNFNNINHYFRKGVARLKSYNQKGRNCGIGWTIRLWKVNCHPISSKVCIRVALKLSLIIFQFKSIKVNISCSRFYDPESGNIELGGKNIREINLRWLRER